MLAVHYCVISVIHFVIIVAVNIIMFKLVVFCNILVNPEVEAWTALTYIQ